MVIHVELKDISSVFGKSRRGGPRARRAPLHPRRAPYGRHWRDFSEEFFVIGGRRGAPIGAFRPEKLLEELFGGTFRRWRAPEGVLQLHFPCKTFAIGGRRTIANGAFGAQGGHGPVSPLPTPLKDIVSTHGILGIFRKIDHAESPLSTEVSKNKHQYITPNCTCVAFQSSPPCILSSSKASVLCDSNPTHTPTPPP